MKLNKLLITAAALAIFSSTCFGAGILTDAKLQYNKAVDYHQQGQFSQAIECFKKATELDPNYIDAYYNLGVLLEYLQQDEDALNAFKQIILRKPDDYEAVYKAAEISKRLGQPEKAKMYLTLIPQDSLIGQRAKELEQSIDTQDQLQQNPEEQQIQEPQTVEEQYAEPQQQAQTFTSANPLNNSNGIYTDIASPTGIATDNEGNLYVAGFSDNTIYKILPNNTKLVYIKSPKINGPIGLVMDKEGNLYVANYNKDNVLKIGRDGQISEIITNIKNPYCMNITDNLLFVSSQGSNSVIRYKLD